MNRSYAALRLLEHGPLRRSEFISITGWPAHKANKTLARLTGSQRATIINIDGKRHYAIKS